MTRNDIIVLASSVLLLASVVVIGLTNSIWVSGVCTFVSLACLVAIDLIYKNEKKNNR